MGDGLLLKEPLWLAGLSVGSLLAILAARPRDYQTVYVDRYTVIEVPQGAKVQQCGAEKALTVEHQGALQGTECEVELATGRLCVSPGANPGWRLPARSRLEGRTKRARPTSTWRPSLRKSARKAEVQAEGPEQVENEQGWARVGSEAKAKEIGDWAVVEQAKAEWRELAASRVQAAVRAWREGRQQRAELRELQECAAVRLQVAARRWLKTRRAQPKKKAQRKSKKQKKAAEERLLDEAIEEAKQEKLKQIDKAKVLVACHIARAGVEYANDLAYEKYVCEQCDENIVDGILYAFRRPGRQSGEKWCEDCVRIDLKNELLTMKQGEAVTRQRQSEDKEAEIEQESSVNEERLVRVSLHVQLGAPSEPDVINGK